MNTGKHKNWSYDKQACGVVHDYVGHFSNPVRLRLLCTLMSGRASVTQLVQQLGEKQPNVSQQLRLLLLAGMVSRTRQGTRQIYEIANPLVGETLEHLSQVAESLQHGLKDRFPQTNTQSDSPTGSQSTTNLDNSKKPDHADPDTNEHA